MHINLYNKANLWTKLNDYFCERGVFVQIPMKRIFILTIIAISLLSIMVFFVFIYNVPARRPSDEPLVFEEQKSNLEDIDHAAHFSTDTSLSEELDKSGTYSEIYIREIPIVLDQEMEVHLAEFRLKAKNMQENYPNDFLISMDTREKNVALTFDDGPAA
jgi:hypothetical protein